MPYRRLLVLTLPLIAALALAACGGDGDGDGGEQGIAAPEEPLPPLTDGEGPLTVDDLDGLAEEAARESAEQAAADQERPEATEEPADVVEVDTPQRTEATTHTVQAGDSLLAIADRFGITLEALLEVNGILDPNDLDVGQVLIIPPQQEDAEDDEDAEDAEGPGEAGEAVIIPARPDQFDAFINAAAGWVNARNNISDCLVPLFEQWGMPPVAGGDRCHLVDTNLDGEASAVVVFTDPRPSDLPYINSDLVIFEPLEDESGYRVAYRLASGEPDFMALDVAVIHTGDLTGDGEPEVTFQELQCGASTCVTIIHVLEWQDPIDAYVDLATGPGLIEIPTATSIDLSDRTGDGVPDITVEGGAFGSVGAGPPCPGRFTYSAAGGVVDLVAVERLPTVWLACAVAPGNEAFDAGEYESALSLYGNMIADTSLQESGFVTNERAEIIAFARLRRALAQAALGDSAEAIIEAQAAAGGEGLHPLLAEAFLAGFAGSRDLSAGCRALNDQLALFVDLFDGFWQQLGYGLPSVRAENLCPF